MTTDVATEGAGGQSSPADPKRERARQLWEDARGEIKQRIQQRDNYAIQTLVAVGALLLAGFSSTSPGEGGVADIAVLATPLVVVYYAQLWTESYKIHRSLARYLRTELEPLLRGAGKPEEWETWYVEQGRLTPGIRSATVTSAAVVVSLLAVAYGLVVGGGAVARNEYQLASDAALLSPGSALWFAVIGYATATYALLLSPILLSDKLGSLVATRDSGLLERSDIRALRKYVWSVLGTAGAVCVAALGMCAGALGLTRTHVSSARFLVPDLLAAWGVGVGHHGSTSRSVAEATWNWAPALLALVLLAVMVFRVVKTARESLPRSVPEAVADEALRLWAAQPQGRRRTLRLYEASPEPVQAPNSSAITIVGDSADLATAIDKLLGTRDVESRSWKVSPRQLCAVVKLRGVVSVRSAKRLGTDPAPTAPSPPPAPQRGGRGRSTG